MSPPILITPDIRQNLKQGLIVSYGQAMAEHVPWAFRVFGAIDVKSTETINAWPEMTIGDFDRGPMGDDLVYQSLKWVNRTLTVYSQGVGFRLYNYDIRDMESRALPAVAMFGAQCGKKAATFNERSASYLLANGQDATKVTARKGGALFRRLHPIGGNSTGTFDTLFEGLDFNMQTLSAVRAYARGIDDGSGDKEAPTAKAFVIVPENYQLRMTQYTNAETLADQISGIANAASNTYYKGQYGYDEPIVTPYLDEPGDWYVVIPGWTVGEEAPLNRMELDGWALTEFTSANQLTLAQSESMESRHTARIGFAGGNPKRIFKIRKSGNASDNADRFKNILAKL